MSAHAFVTLATTDAYALGALVLAESLRQTRTQAKLVVLTSHHLSDTINQTLQSTFDEVIPVEELNSNDDEHLRLLARPELGVTFTKINCWLLEQYEKCVFLDSDCLVLRSIDELFEREEFSAARDAGWPDCFNSGVFVYRPSRETFRRLMEFSSEQNVSFDGGDQGLLNEFFSDWRTTDISRHLPFTFNVTANAFYSYLPAITRFRNDIHVVHFAGAMKPWQLTYNPQNDQLSGNPSGQSDVQREFLLSWWKIMHQHVWPKLSKLNQTSTSDNPSFTSSQTFPDQFSGSLHYANLTSNSGVELGSAAHRRAWEAGHVDYFGRDSFSNIQQQLERSIAHLPQPTPQAQPHPSKAKEISPERPIMDQPKPVQHPRSVPLTKINPPLASQPVVKPAQSAPTQITTQPSHPVKVIPITVTKEIIPPVRSPVQPTSTPSTSVVEQTKTSAHSLATTQSSMSSTDQSPPTHPHESNWTVKSTIVTAYSQGAGPTVVSKVVSETCASSANDVPVVTSIKQKTDGIVLPEKALPVKGRNDHFAWLFDKVFIAITYTISLCYLLFLVAIRRSKSSSLVDDNGVSLRHLTSSPSTANENRVKK